MSKAQILDALDAAGDALKATGEASIVFSYNAGSSGDLFTVRLETHGEPGVHGHGSTPRAAFARALAQRSDDQERARIRAEIEAEVAHRFEPFAKVQAIFGGAAR